MVTNITGFGRSGIADFVLQRVSAAVLGLYGLCLGGFFAITPHVDHAALVGLR